MHLDYHRLVFRLGPEAASASANVTHIAAHGGGEISGLKELVIAAACWTGGWVVLFYSLVRTYHFWGGRLRESSKEHENDPYWCARSVLGTLHALLVAALSLPSAWALLGAPEAVKFASSDHLASCAVDTSDSALLEWDSMAQTVALAGLAFTTFTLADVVVSALHGLATTDYMVHHAVFIACGVLIRGNCMLPFNAAVLMAMEVSTPFLNTMVLLRNRGDAYKTSVIVNGVVFFVTYLLFRIVLNGYGTVLLWVTQFHGAAMPPKVPTWQAWFLAVAVSAGLVVQLFWLPGVLNSVGSKMLALLRDGDVATDGDEAQDGQSSGCQAAGS